MRVIIDGSNVLCYGSDRTDGKVQCNPLYVDAVFSALSAKGIDWFCFFDANCVKRVSETCSCEDLDLFLGLLNKNASKICIIPGGTRADSWILQKADREDLKIITNDHYRDDEYVRKFPWLGQERSSRADCPERCRLLPFLFADGQLQILDLDICWDLKSESEVREANAAGLTKDQVEKFLKDFERFSKKLDDCSKQNHENIDQMLKEIEEARGKAKQPKEDPWWVVALNLVNEVGKLRDNLRDLGIGRN